MATGTDIPVRIEPDAVEFIAQMGMQKEFDTMLEHARQTIPGLQFIDARYDDDPTANIPGVFIWAHREDQGLTNNEIDDQWNSWIIKTFPPEVLIRFGFWVTSGDLANGR
jgi:hypothetical protein